ncbi:lipase-like [Curcuma longa]|uniref:lipase-like n=1 Tax=Curcuma longa TaxID=136217 RepID=UPI003D9F5C67
MAFARRTWLMLLVLVGWLGVSGGREIAIEHENNYPCYNQTIAKILVEYASAVYITDLTALYTWTCSRCNDLTEGFEMVELIVDVENCLQAFVGVDHDLNSTIIAIRGTSENSIKNWIQDLFWVQLDLNYPGVKDAKVHHGFYRAYHNTALRYGITSAVQRIKELYGDIQIMVTGHSMGGAIASFCALDLNVNYGVEHVQLMTFGQPRVGNPAFAAYFSKQVPDTIRVTHAKDIVPHLPPYYASFSKRTYHHFPREVWLHRAEVDGQEYIEEKICDGSGEDPTCSRSVYGTSLADHLEYYGVDLEADAWGSCRALVDASVSQYYLEYNGSIILWREPTTLHSKIVSPRSVGSSL